MNLATQEPGPAAETVLPPGAAATNLPEMLRAQALMNPTGTAVICGSEHLTFGELAESAAKLGAYLRGRGVNRDDCVGMLVEPSLDLMIGAWGILSAGAAYLPLSPEYPEERLRHMIAHSQARVFFCQEQLRPRLMELAPPNVTIVTLGDVAHDTVYRKKVEAQCPLN